LDVDDQVQRHALLTVGNLAFCWENRRSLLASESLRDLLLRLSAGSDAGVCKAAIRALAILGKQIHFCSISLICILAGDRTHVNLFEGKVFDCTLNFCYQHSGENEYLRRAVKGRPVAKQGLRILSMDGGGMRGLATVQMLRRIEQGTGRRIHEMFDLICGTSTGGMLACALGIKQMNLDECEEIYKSLGMYPCMQRFLQLSSSCL
jgi:hypothetical protein